MQTLQQLVEQNRSANERYERLLEEYERSDERNAGLKPELIQYEKWTIVTREGEKR
jgi:hypothetical protein